MISLKKIHLVGIGGAGMSGIAETLLNLGYQVSGSDIVKSEITSRLESLGSFIDYNHSARLVEDKDLVVVSSAITEKNPEVVKARELGIPVIKRAEMLANLMMLKESLAIAGSHGKTTITCILAHIFSHNKLDPTYIIGGKVESFESNAKLGKGRHIFTEADESDGSFLLLRPHKAIISNIDNDHLEAYDNNFETLKNSFREFCMNVPFQGKIFMNGDFRETQEIVKNLPRTVISFGFERENDYLISNYKQQNQKSFFSIEDTQNKKTMCFSTTMLGKHNVLNTAAAIIYALDEGLSYKNIKDALETFIVVERRFQLISKNVFDKDIVLIDDYGHHPSEIQASISTVKDSWPDRELLLVFQPHRYSRTKALFNDFISILSECKNLILLEIYPASEEPIKGYESEDLIKQIKAKNPEAMLVRGIEEAYKEMQKFNKDNFIFLTQGAGNTSALAAKFKTTVN